MLSRQDAAREDASERRGGACESSGELVGRGDASGSVADHAHMNRTFVLEFSLRTSKADERALTIRLEAARNIYNACLLEALRHHDRRSCFTASSIQRYAQRCRDACWIKDHLCGHDMQTASLRAFRAVDQDRRGQRGRPRLAVEFNSLEGKEAKSTIVFRGDRVVATCKGRDSSSAARRGSRGHRGS
jgi:hypothetical protein